MNEQKRFEVLARIDGYDVQAVCLTGAFPVYREPAGHWNELPDYNSRDNLQGVIDGLDMRSTLNEYYYELMHIMVRDRGGLHVREHEMTLATVPQIQEAIIRAFGMWEEW